MMLAMLSGEKNPASEVMAEVSPRKRWRWRGLLASGPTSRCVSTVGGSSRAHDGRRMR
jgi:hypothetical protein